MSPDTAGLDAGQLDKVVLVAARTARSQAYAQEMLRRGLAPGLVLLMGPKPRGPQPRTGARSAGSVRLPNLCESLEATVARAGWRCESVAADSVNDPVLLERLRAAKPSAVVYSGGGGQIVGREALEIAPFVHAHAGWLPRERGSTTIFYRLIEEGDCAVSVLLLEPSIDAGPILARRRYPAPPAETDIDYHYDPGIRADLLCEVLERFAATGTFAGEAVQDARAETMYYVIHPVLKHLAVLRTENETRRPGADRKA